MNPTLNKDGTPRKAHKKGAGRPNTGRTARLGLKLKPETLQAIRDKAKASGLSIIETIERKFPI